MPESPKAGCLEQFKAPSEAVEVRQETQVKSEDEIEEMHGFAGHNKFGQYFYLDEEADSSRFVLFDPFTLKGVAALLGENFTERLRGYLCGFV